MREVASRHDGKHGKQDDAKQQDDMSPVEKLVADAVVVHGTDPKALAAAFGIFDGAMLGEVMKVVHRMLGNSFARALELELAALGADVPRHGHHKRHGGAKAASHPDGLLEPDFRGSTPRDSGADPDGLLKPDFGAAHAWAATPDLLEPNWEAGPAARKGQGSDILVPSFMEEKGDRKHGKRKHG